MRCRSQGQAASQYPLPRALGNCSRARCARAACAAVLVLAAGCSSLPVTTRAAPERWGFTIPGDVRSAASARANAGALDALVLGWIVLDSATGLPLQPVADTLSRTLTAGVRRMAMVTTLHGPSAHPALVRRLAMDSMALKRTSAAIADVMQRAGYRGLVIPSKSTTSPR
jgi:hypothetical protein